MPEGKTKIVTPCFEGCHIAIVETKDDMTAFDKKIHEVMAGKAELATRTTCNVFERLRSRGVPLAYIGRDGPKTFLTRICTMILVEVVVRWVATGSYCTRFADVKKGTILTEPVVEFFYKTTDKTIGDRKLPCDDPLMVLGEDGSEYDLYFPDRPNEVGYIGPLGLTEADTRTLASQLATCKEIALEAGEHLREAWKEVGGDLYDYKTEYGTLPDGEIVLSDVIDCDSWRVLWEGLQLSKQPFRERESLDRVLGVYRIAASLSDRFV